MRWSWIERCGLVKCVYLNRDGWARTVGVQDAWDPRAALVGEQPPGSWPAVPLAASLLLGRGVAGLVPGVGTPLAVPGESLVLREELVRGWWPVLPPRRPDCQTGLLSVRTQHERTCLEKQDLVGLTDMPT